MGQRSSGSLHKSERTLVAVLANPRPRDGSRTEKRIALVRDALGYERAEIVNLFSRASESSREIAVLGVSAEGWREARVSVSEAIASADSVLLGFGLIPSSRESRPHLRAQLEWLRHELQVHGHLQVWQVGDRPRHPSRWHQYVSDTHGRTVGGTFEQRLKQVLRTVPLNDCRWA
ncbi:DUF1643 domain-containing protein [Microbacterium phyllosphaerae]|uniref:DUF1643 domain-containing protein n=1 Tax=Microbacterium phyllosphaerae TaxID=124798 RepID=UPI003D6589A2